MGIIEIEMFSEEVDSPDHPVADSFKELLEEVAEEYGCHLTYFDVDQGKISFSFDDEELTAEIIKVLRMEHRDI